jgi:ADP-heptose:LPS heptosyltransferase
MTERRRVLVARLDAMGDVLLMGPAVRAIAARAEVTMLCGPAGTHAAWLLPGVTRVLTWDAPWITSPPPPVTASALQDLRTRVAGQRFDAAVILTSFHQSPLPLALLLRLAGVPRIVGASTDYAGSLLDVRLRPGEDLDEDIPEPERALRIAAAAGFELPAGDDGALRVVTGIGGPPIEGAYVVLHPGASAPARSWPAARFAQTARRFADRGIRVVVTGAARERQLTAQVAGDRALDLGGRLSLPGLARLLAGATALVGANTGPAHLAAAVGTPVISLFAPVVPAVRWRPYRVPHVLLGDQEAACRGTRARVCPVAGHPCLAGVTPDDVLAAYAVLVDREAA